VLLMWMCYYPHMKIKVEIDDENKRMRKEGKDVHEVDVVREGVIDEGNDGKGENESMKNVINEENIVEKKNDSEKECNEGTGFDEERNYSEKECDEEKKNINDNEMENISRETMDMTGSNELNGKNEICKNRMDGVKNDGVIGEETEGIIEEEGVDDGLSVKSETKEREIMREGEQNDEDLLIQRENDGDKEKKVNNDEVNSAKGGNNVNINDSKESNTVSNAQQGMQSAAGKINDMKEDNDLERLQRMQDQFLQKDEPVTANSVIVRNLDHTITKQVLIKHLHACGTIKSVEIPQARKSGQPTKNYAFVEFMNRSGVNIAMSLNNKLVINGRRLSISRKKVFNK
ncbi:Splicing factor RNPS1, SR protein superfamily, partial [Trachipleistophora hominis]